MSQYYLSSDDIRQLRKETGREMKSVKFALIAYNGNKELAKKYLMENCPPPKCRCGIPLGDPHP